MPERAITGEMFERLREATASNPAELTELCRDYLSEARATIGHLREAIAKRDAQRLRDRAHYLKGSSMMIGARELSQHCATLEQLARDGKLDDVETPLQHAVSALQAVEFELAARLGPAVVPAEGSAA